MAIRPSPTQRRPCPRYRASPRPKPTGHPDIKVASHKLTVQHSVRAQKLDERQLSKFFKSLDDLRIKRLLQIDKEMSEQEKILEKLDYEREVARERRQNRRGNSSRSTFADSDLSSLLPDHFKRGPRPSVRRNSSNFDLYAFMMRRESDHAVVPITDGKQKSKKTLKNTSQKQPKESPLPNSRLKSPNWEDRKEPVLAREAWNEVEHRVVSPGKSEQLVLTPLSIASLAESMSIHSLPPSSPVCELNDNVTSSPIKRNFPRGSEWSGEDGVGDVNKGIPGRVREQTPRSRKPEAARGSSRQQKQSKTSSSTKDKQDGSDRRYMPKATKNSTNSSAGARGSQRRDKLFEGKLKKEVSFHFDNEDDEDDLASTKLAVGGGIMEKNNLLKAAPTSPPSALQPSPECKEPDCIFHSKAYRQASHGDDYTIDDYYRTVSGKPVVSPLFMPAGSPRSWSRRGMVRPPSPILTDFLREFDGNKPSTEASKAIPAESDGFLSVRRPLKGSNRERMLQDKEENVRTTFKLMRQKMADQKPPEFNQNYGTPTPNWKILNPLKMRHKINQSNPLHVIWGL